MMEVNQTFSNNHVGAQSELTNLRQEATVVNPHSYHHNQLYRPLGNLDVHAVPQLTRYDGTKEKDKKGRVVGGNRKHLPRQKLRVVLLLVPFPYHTIIDIQ